MVYNMLMEASDSPDPSQFKQSDLYRRCVAAGVVPATEAELEQANQNPPDATALLSAAADPETLPLQYVVSGMWCPACSWVIETALRKAAGVRHATCDYSTDRLHCRYDPKHTDPGASPMPSAAWGTRFLR